MVCTVRKHELLGMKKDVHGKTSLRACSLVPTCGIYLFQYLQVTKKIASNYLWLQCTVCRDYKQATRTMRIVTLRKVLKVRD